MTDEAPRASAGKRILQTLKTRKGVVTGVLVGVATATAVVLGLSEGDQQKLVELVSNVSRLVEAYLQGS